MRSGFYFPWPDYASYENNFPDALSGSAKPHEFARRNGFSRNDGWQPAPSSATMEAGAERRETAAVREAPARRTRRTGATCQAGAAEQPSREPRFSAASHAQGEAGHRLAPSRAPLFREAPGRPASASIACASASPGRLGKQAAAMLAEARIPPVDLSADGTGPGGQRRARLAIALAAPNAALAHGPT